MSRTTLSPTIWAVSREVSSPSCSRKPSFWRCLPNSRVSRLDRLVDQVTTLVVGQEGTLHRIDRNLLEIIKGKPESFRGSFKFPRHRRGAHQPVIGVQCYPELLLVQNLEGMLFKAGRRTGVDVAEEADLEGNTFVENILSEIAQFDRLSVGDSDIIDQASPMADAVCSAVLDSLPDRLLAESFPRVNGDVEVFSLDVVKSVYVFLRGIPTFFSSQVKTHNPTFAKVDRQFRHFERYVHVAHRADQQSRADTEILAAACHPSKHGRDHLLVCQSFVCMENGCETSFVVDYSVA